VEEREQTPSGAAPRSIDAAPSLSPPAPPCLRHLPPSPPPGLKLGVPVCGPPTRLRDIARRRPRPLEAEHRAHKKRPPAPPFGAPKKELAAGCLCARVPGPHKAGHGWSLGERASPWRAGIDKGPWRAPRLASLFPSPFNPQPPLQGTASSLPSHPRPQPCPPPPPPPPTGGWRA